MACCVVYSQSSLFLHSSTKRPLDVPCLLLQLDITCEPQATHRPDGGVQGLSASKKSTCRLGASVIGLISLSQTRPTPGSDARPVWFISVHPCPVAASQNGQQAVTSGTFGGKLQDLATTDQTPINPCTGDGLQICTSIKVEEVLSGRSDGDKTAFMWGKQLCHKTMGSRSFVAH